VTSPRPAARTTLRTSSSCTSTAAFPVRTFYIHIPPTLIPFFSPPPDAMIVSHFPHGPTVYFTLNNVALRHDIASYRASTVSEQYPHLIFENFSSALGQRIRDCLKYLFPVPKEDSKRVMTFANDNDFISFRCVTHFGNVDMAEARARRHHVFVTIPPKQVQLAEVGPRFEMKRMSLPSSLTHFD
jgi:rRNA maturation protein Rpf1